MQLSDIPEREGTAMLMALTDSPVRNSIFNVLYSMGGKASNEEIAKKVGVPWERYEHNANILIDVGLVKTAYPKPDSLELTEAGYVWGKAIEKSEAKQKS